MGRTRSPARIVFMTWNVALVAWVVLAASRGALRPGLFAELALAWFAVATVGVVVPALEMYGPIVQRGPTGRRAVALTFDDGPHPVTTRRILATLAGTKHRATFFVLGAKARRHPDVLREIQAAGHTIGLHGDEHDRLHSFRMPWRVHRDLVRAARAVEDATGVRPRLYRPPLGHTSANAAPGVRRAGMLVIGWSTRGLDGMRTQTPDAVVARIGASLTDGDIVMLHDAAERDDYEPASIRALPELLRLLDDRGWTSVGVDALIDTAAWHPSSSCSTGAAGGRRMPTIALVLLALLARTPSASAQATALPLPDPDQQVITTMLGTGVVGQALPSNLISDVSVYFPLVERTRSFQVTSGPKAGQIQSLSVKKGQRPNGNPAWRFEMAPSLFAFVNADGGNLTLVSMSDTSEGLLIITTPSDPFLVQGMQPGETRRLQQNVSVRYLDDPSDQRYAGTVDGELTYVGTYQVTVPAGTYPAILLRQKLSGKVGPAHAEDTAYYFFAPKVGVVAMIRQEDVEAFWIVHVDTKMGKVLAGS